MSWWLKWFCWCKFYTQEGKPKNVKLYGVRFWNIFSESASICYDWEKLIVLLSTSIATSRSMPKENSLIFLLSDVYIIGMEQRYQGVGILYISENKIMFLFTVFLRRSCFQSKGWVHINIVVYSKKLSKMVLNDPHLLAFVSLCNTHPCMWATTNGLLLREYGKNYGISHSWLCYKRLWHIGLFPLLSWIAFFNEISCQVGKVHAARNPW